MMDPAEIFAYALVGFFVLGVVFYSIPSALKELGFFRSNSKEKEKKKVDWRLEGTRRRNHCRSWIDDIEERMDVYADLSEDVNDVFRKLMLSWHHLLIDFDFFSENYAIRFDDDLIESFDQIEHRYQVDWAKNDEAFWSERFFRLQARYHALRYATFLCFESCTASQIDSRVGRLIDLESHIKNSTISGPDFDLDLLTIEIKRASLEYEIQQESSVHA